MCLNTLIKLDCWKPSFALTYQSFAIKQKSFRVDLDVIYNLPTFLVHLSQKLKCTIVITRCPSVINFSHFQLLLWNPWTEFNKTWQEVRTHWQHPLPSLSFSCWTENKMAALASDWLRHFRLLLWNCWTEFNETWNLNGLYQVFIFRAISKQNWQPWLIPQKRWHIVLRCRICGPLYSTSS